MQFNILKCDVSKRKVGNEKVDREKGYIYFIDSDGYVSRARPGRQKKE